MQNKNGISIVFNQLYKTEIKLTLRENCNNFCEVEMFGLNIVCFLFYKELEIQFTFVSASALLFIAQAQLQ